MDGITEIHFRYRNVILIIANNVGFNLMAPSLRTRMTRLVNHIAAGIPLNLDLEAKHP